MSSDLESLIFYTFVGATGLFTSIFVSMRYIKSCNSPFCSCQQDTALSAAAQTDQSVKQKIFQAIRSVKPPNTTPNGSSGARPIATWGNDNASSSNRPEQNNQDVRSMDDIEEALNQLTSSKPEHDQR